MKGSSWFALLAHVVVVAAAFPQSTPSKLDYGAPIVEGNVVPRQSVPALPNIYQGIVASRPSLPREDIAVASRVQTPFVGGTVEMKDRHGRVQNCNIIGYETVYGSRARPRTPYVACPVKRSAWRHLCFFCNLFRKGTPDVEGEL